jgi:hypothetical protein
VGAHVDLGLIRDTTKGGRPNVELYVISLAVLVGGGLLVGFVFRWWGLIAPVGFACFLAYAWEFYSPAVAYAVIAGLISCCGVVAGSLLRRALR